MNLNSLNDLFTSQVQDLYSAETQLLDALPKMASAATNSDLRDAFQSHLTETREHANRLQQVLKIVHAPAGSETCQAMKGLIKEGEETIRAHGDATVKDAALIAAAQRVEHYEIAGYGTAATLADQLGLSEAKDLLGQTLDEEKNADSKLTKLATGGWLSKGINAQSTSA